jgi:hypothetical protein
MVNRKVRKSNGLYTVAGMRGGEYIPVYGRPCLFLSTVSCYTIYCFFNRLILSTTGGWE